MHDDINDDDELTAGHVSFQPDHGETVADSLLSPANSSAPAVLLRQPETDHDHDFGEFDDRSTECSTPHADAFSTSDSVDTDEVTLQNTRDVTVLFSWKLFLA